MRRKIKYPEVMYNWTTIVILLALEALHLYLTYWVLPGWEQYFQEAKLFLLSVSVWILLLVLGLRVLATCLNFLPNGKAGLVSWALIIPSWLIGTLDYQWSQIAGAPIASWMEVLVLGGLFGAIRILPTAICFLGVVLHLWLWVNSSPSARVYITHMVEETHQGYYIRNEGRKMWHNPDRREIPLFTSDLDRAFGFTSFEDARRTVRTRGLTRMLSFWER